VDSEEIARHIREQEHTGKRGAFDAEKRREHSRTLSNVEKCVENENFDEFCSLLDSLNVTKVEKRRVAVAQFYQMVSEHRRKKSGPHGR